MAHPDAMAIHKATQRLHELIRAEERAKTVEACLAAFKEQMDLLEIASGNSEDKIVIDTCREFGTKAIKGVADK